MSDMTRTPQAIPDRFGENVFSLLTMRNYLSEKAYTSLRDTIVSGTPLDPQIADEVADAMKTWALEKGATHFTHWFQPLTGATAEKHESFLTPDAEGGALMQFSGQELIQGEPDASSFPSGGLRATFEARGYTAWDPTSPAFVKECKDGAVLCIPTVFCGWNGEALDKKTPLLRSMEALSLQVCRLGRLFGLEVEGKRAYVTLGPEQEYFLVDRRFVAKRLDLLQTGRTLFGRAPAKHQQLEDHYFGAIRTRVMDFMTELDQELWRLGIPAKTRHNEVCPAQFELAPTFENLNLAVDHNMLTMEVLQRIAEKHGLVCLLHEKPFAGVNGSGKHNNWSIRGPDGKNWLSPGDNPAENAKFLTLLVALLRAVDLHADILRASVASAGNDHRLGANEAPPAIVSIYLGEQLTDILAQIETGCTGRLRKGGFIELGVSSLPRLPRHATDRNRTSPFAFTGNKFEFRAVGSRQSCAGPNVVMNTITAESLDMICTRLEKAVAEGRAFHEALQETLRELIAAHKRIIYNGDNYTAEWRAEAERRGLPNLRTTPESLEALTTPKAKRLFARYGVLSETELQSRYEVYREQYERQVGIEARCALQMARTMIAPAALAWQAELAQSVTSLETTGANATAARSTLAEVSGAFNAFYAAIQALEQGLQGEGAAKIGLLANLRTAADALEGLVPASRWPLPSYAEMLFMD